VVSLFGQVWLWSLLSFVAGVLVTWLVQVRPAKQRLAELEASRLGAFAGPARPQPAAPPSPVSSPMRDEEFDDWHVGARVNSDAVLAPPPTEQTWPSTTAQQAPRSYEPPRPAEPYEPPRPAELSRPLEPQRLIEPPRPLETPLPVRPPEPRQGNDVVPFTPVSAFSKALEPEPEPVSDHDYDELPPALTRIPENAEPSRVVEPVEVPEEEKPRSLFQRLTPADEVQAEPVPLNPAQEPTVFRRADLDELPDVSEIPADRARYQPPGAAEIAPPQEEPTAPPEVPEWHPREMWREEEEEQAELAQAVAQAEHEDELLDDREEDFAADDSLPATVEADTTADAEADTDAEDTSVIPASEVQRAIDAADARRDTERQSWPEHSLTGQFPVITDDIASSKGQLGVQPDDPDYRRDDPDELTTSGADRIAASEQAAQSSEPRPSDHPTTEFISVQSLTAESLAGKPADPELSAAESSDSKASEPNAAEPAPSPAADVRPAEPRTVEPVTSTPQAAAPEPGQTESRQAESRLPESRATDFRPTEFGAVSSRATEFFPAAPTLADQSRAAKSSAAPSRSAESRAADFFAPQPPEAEPVPAPVAKPKLTPPQPASERPRSLFEPIVGASDDDPEPAETVRHLPPTDDQPFVPTLAPSLLERGSNGLPQRPQRPAGGPPPMTSPPLLGPPQPVSPPPLPPKRPRPVGFSPSTGGRSETPAPVAPRYQQSEGFNPRSPFGPGSVLPKSDGHAPAADFEVKATLTGRRYFRPGTASFDDTRADVWFRTEADAQKAGFRPAQ